MLRRQRGAARGEKNEMFHFRPVVETDRKELQRLHEEWFPVRYKDSFYDSVVNNRIELSENSNRSDLSQLRLFTNVATVHQDEIAGCVIGCMNHFSIFTNGSDPFHSCELRRKLLPRGSTELFYIMTLGVKSEYRFLGLGRRLIRRAITYASMQPKCGTVYLHVIVHNDAAIQFYHSLGFERVDELEDYYTIDNKNFNCYVYAKFLKSHPTPMPWWSGLLGQCSWCAWYLTSPLLKIFSHFSGNLITHEENSLVSDKV